MKFKFETHSISARLPLLATRLTLTPPLPASPSLLLPLPLSKAACFGTNVKFSIPTSVRHHKKMWFLKQCCRQ